jgi:hypothetical protein
LTSLRNTPKMPSNNKFGWFFSVVFATIAIFAFYKQLKTLAVVAILFFVFFAATTFFAPQLLTSLNRLWYALGIHLGKVISPIVLGAMFFFIITPIALITRLFGRDELKIRKLSLQSYWVDRSPPGPPSESFNNQF